MKTYLKILLFFLLVTQICFAQWEWQNPLPQGNNLNDVSFSNKYIGYAVGDKGTIIKSFDGGQTWKNLEIVTSENLISVDFLSPENGIAVGDSGTIIKTNNGGDSWRIQAIGYQYQFIKVIIMDENISWIIDKDSTVFKSIDGGTSWIKQNIQLPKGMAITDICFIDKNFGWISGNYISHGVNYWNIPQDTIYVVLIRTTDGGITWKQHPKKHAPNIGKTCFTDQYYGWAVGNGGNPYSGLLFWTTDGGNFLDWRNITIANELSSIQFIDRNNGWMVGDNQILRTKNGGLYWTRQNSGTTQKLHKVLFLDEYNGVIVGENGTTLFTKDGGENWNHSNNSTITSSNLSYVHFLDKNNGWIVGNDGIILRTINGKDWVVQESGVKIPLSKVFFTDYSNGYAIGSGWVDTNYSQVILITKNGGINWETQSFEGYDQLNDIFFKDLNNGWVLRNNSVLKTTDGGWSWTNNIIDTLGSFSSIYFTDLQNGFAVGSGSYPCWGRWCWSPTIANFYKTIDGGISWTNMLPDTLNFGLSSIHFFDQNNGWILGDGIILKTENGGTDWMIDTSSYEVYRSAFILDQNNFWALDEHGTILHSIDIGKSWQKQSIQTTSQINGIFFTDQQNGWVVGQNGTILHTTNGGVTFVEEEQTAVIPKVFLLSQNYPNPFNPSTKINYIVNAETFICLKVFDVLGREVTVLVNEQQKPGNYQIEWNAENFPSGVYFYRLKAGEFAETMKMVLMK